MTTKDIFGFLTIPIQGNSKIQVPVLNSNVFFRFVLRRRATTVWDTNNAASSTAMYVYPWKMGGLLVDDSDLKGHMHFADGYNTDYPFNVGTIGVFDYSKFRTTGTAGTIASSAISRVIGAVGAHDDLISGVTNMMFIGNNMVSINDVPTEYTQIGIVYQHPMHAGGSDISTTIGQSYVSFANLHYFDSEWMGTHTVGIIRIASGADTGMYFVRFVDKANNRMYLMNLDGTLFSPSATASSLTWYAGPGRRAFFNEVSIIQLSTGTIMTGGTFRPGRLASGAEVRNSFIMRITFDKTGSDETAAASEKQGSYYVSMKPYTHGDGLTTPASGLDWGSMMDTAFNLAGSTLPTNFNFFDGGVNGITLNERDQRLWFMYQAAAGGCGIAHWRWKTAEAFREVAWNGGVAGDPTMLTPSLVLGAGDIGRAMHSGPEGVVYGAISHATGGNGGVFIIKADLSTLQYKNTTPSWFATGADGSNVAAVKVDWSRARTGTAGDVVTTVGTNDFTSASGAFTDADLFRVIKITGATADNGTYLIATRSSGTAIELQTLAGGAVVLTGGTGGTFQIGERCYVFFNNGTSAAPAGAGRICYMESMAFGSFFTRTVTMTNGSSCHVQQETNGEQPKVDIDQATGNVYWTSRDVAEQFNKYNVALNTHSFLTIANVQSPAGGTGTLGTITQLGAVAVNPKFDEIWLGTDQGAVKVVKSTFAAATVKRYFGDSGLGTYENPAGFRRPSGWNVNTQSTYFPRILNFYILPDGRVGVQPGSGAAIRSANAWYSREADVFLYKEDFYMGIAVAYSAIFDSIGNWFQCAPASVSHKRFSFGSVEIQYQWDTANSRWTPLEVYQGALPQKSSADTISPGCQAKPMHSALEEVLYGVKIRFVKQGGATPSNNEFLGRAALSKALATDGVTTLAGTTFGGSGFLSGDVGNILRIETGADAGVYKITDFTNSTLITVNKLTNVVASFAANTGLSYTIWTFGGAGSNAGPETATVLLSDGFGKDNTQDISGITYEKYHFKTTIHDNAEAIKFCVPNPIGVAGGPGDMKVYYDTFPRVATAILASHDLQTTHARALPAAEHISGGINGRKLTDGIIDALANGTGTRGLLWSSPANANTWYGILPVSAALGCCPMVDLGEDAEVGYIIIRGTQITSDQALTYVATNHGLKSTLYKANSAGGTPVASSVSRTSGVTNLSVTANVTTITTSGDFLGPVFLASASNGSVTAGGNTFTAPAATFSTVVPGMILKILSVGDVGSYRITAVDGTGAILTVAALNQAAYAWLGSASSIVYEIRDGVREEDVICIPSIGAPTQRLCIERLLTTTTAEVRVAPHTTLATQNWQCAIPTWSKVKRISYSSEAVPPEVKDNKTWICMDGREQFKIEDFKINVDMTDLSSAARTGRWWQLQMMPRFAGNTVSGDFYFSTWEFYTPAGLRIGVSQYTFSNPSLTNSDFLSQHVNRLDMIQSSYLAVGAGFNGVAALGGADGNTVTLGGGNKFLGFQVRRPYADGVSTAGPGGNFSSATAVFITSDTGRTLHIQTGADAGYYRINSVSSPTAVLVTTINGGAVTFIGAAATTFSIHEGFSIGGASPDRLVFLDDTTREYTVATLDNALTTLTIAETDQVAVSGKQWEIRRPAYDSTASAIDSTKLARLVRPGTTYPLQQGDVACDSRGAMRFWVDDIGSATVRADGSITGGSGVFTGTNFCADDVGRILVITTGVNKGPYRISVFTSATSITVINEYTGAAVSFTADAGPVSYKLYGDRRYRLTKYVTTLRA